MGFNPSCVDDPCIRCAEGGPGTNAESLVADGWSFRKGNDPGFFDNPINL